MRHFSRHRLSALATVLVVLALGAVPATRTGQARPQALPSLAFSSEVLARLSLMQGGPNSANVAPGTTFAQLQQQITALATNLTLPLYLDPTTGRSWDLPVLLQRASDRASWLGAGSSVRALQTQIEQVLSLLVWRRGDGYQAGLSPGESTIARQAWAHAPNCPFGATGYTPPGELRNTWAQLFPQALAAKASTFGGGALGTIIDWSVQGGEFNGTQISGPVASVLVTRDLWTVSLVPNAPIPGVPLDGARLIFPETQYATSGSLYKQISSLADLQQLGAVVAPLPRIHQIGLSDFDLAGTSMAAQNYATQVGGAFNAVWNIPLVLVLRPGVKSTQPQLLPGLLLRINMEEPPKGFPPAGPLIGSCLWGATATLTSPALLFREDLPPMTAATVHIGTAQLAGLDRVRELEAEDRAQVGSLDKEKEALAALLPKQRELLATDEVAVTSLDATVTTLQAKIAQTRSFVAQISSAEKKLPPAVQELLASRDTIGENISQTQDQILAAQQAGNTAQVKALQQTLAAEQAVLADRDRQLAGKDGTVDELLDKWMTELRRLQGQLFTAQSGRAGAEFKLGQDLVALQDSSTRQDSVDNQLLDLNQSLTNLDFDLQNVAVDADGRAVFGAKFTSPYAQVETWNALIAAIKSYEPEAEAARKTALAQYKTAEMASISALQTIENTIRSNSYKKAGVDAAFYAWDLAWAASKGGVAGLGTELAKKAVDAAIGLVTYSLDKEGGATEFNKGYSASLSQVMGSAGPAFLPPGKALKVALEKLVKDATLKPAKDALNYQIGKNIINKVLRETPALYLQGISSPPSLTGFSAARFVQEAKTFWNGFRNTGLQLNNLVKTTKFSDRVKDLGVGVLKDISKATLKAYIDTSEQLAWSDYFYKEVVAQTYFPLWQLASNDYWEVEDALQGAETSRDMLEEGYDPSTGTKVGLDVPFQSGASLNVVLAVVRSTTATAPLHIGVTIAGAPASPSGDLHYALSSSGLTEGPRGLGLTVNAKY